MNLLKITLLQPSMDTIHLPQGIVSHFRNPCLGRPRTFLEVQAVVHRTYALTQRLPRTAHDTTITYLHSDVLLPLYSHIMRRHQEYSDNEDTIATQLI